MIIKIYVVEVGFGAPCGIRTHGPRIRNPVLYPSELRGRSKIYRNIRYLWHLLIWVGGYDQI